jgi:hypothetical protein
MIKSLAPLDYQGDFEKIVGVVFKKTETGTPELSSISELISSNATQIDMGQVCTFWNDSLEGYNTVDVLSKLFVDPGTSDLLMRAFGDWSNAAYDQWIQVRSLSVVNESSTTPGAMIYKLIVDAYTSPVEP